jgi:hypothetical protein
MKVHRIVISVIDFDGLGAEEVREILEGTRYPNRCISPKVEEIQTRDIGEWGDDHPLNKLSSARAYFKALFQRD